MSLSSTQRSSRAHLNDVTPSSIKGMARKAPGTPRRRSQREGVVKARSVEPSPRARQHQELLRKRVQAEIFHSPISIRQFASDDSLPLPDVTISEEPDEMRDLRIEDHMTDSTEEAFLNSSFDELLLRFGEGAAERSYLAVGDDDVAGNLEFAAWGNDRVSKSAHVVEFTAINFDDPSLTTFKDESSKIEYWLRTIPEYAFTLLRYRGVPHLLIITPHPIEISECPSNLPIRLVNSTVGPFVVDYDNEPINPYHADEALPGSSIGVEAAATCGAVIKGPDGRYLLTAGHALRKRLTQGQKLPKKPTKDAFPVFHPAEKDVKKNRSVKSSVIVEGGLASAKAQATLLLKEAEAAMKFAEIKPEDEAAQREAQIIREEARKVRKVFQFIHHRKLNLKEAAKKVGDTVISVIRTTKLNDGRTCVEDWGLVSLDGGLNAINSISIFGRTLTLKETEEIRPGMVVVKRGRSTGITIGVVNGVDSKVQMELSDRVTSEWTVLPAADDDLPTDLKSNDLLEDDGTPILRDIFGYIGDSGSLVINWETKKVVAMITGGAPSKKTPVTYVTPISLILDWMQAELTVRNLELE